MKARENRQKVVIPARMRNESGWVDVIIHNLSSRGLGLRSAHAPERDSYIEIFRHHYKLIGRVAWRNGDNFGVRLQDRVDIDAFTSSQPRKRDDDGATERRAAPRDIALPRPSIEERLERSRRIARLTNFAALLAGMAVAAYFLVTSLQSALAPLQKVIAAL